MSGQRKYRTWTAQQKIEIVIAGLRGDRSVKVICREHEIAETLYYSWREKLLEGGKVMALKLHFAQPIEFLRPSGRAVSRRRRARRQ